MAPRKANVKASLKHISAPLRKQQQQPDHLEEGGQDLASLMSDANYLRQSSALIHEALQKGYDVLQMPNGDIVTTGTKTLVFQYQWDAENNRLARAPEPKKAPRKTDREEFIEETLDS